MRNKYPLLQQLTELDQNPPMVLPPGIKYEAFTLTVNGELTEVFIPAREANGFRQAVSEHDEKFDSTELNELLRTHRGIRNRNET